MITVSLTEQVTEDLEAYKTLMDTLIAIHESNLLNPSDFICYNIGSPVQNKYLRSDFQRYMPSFEEMMNEHRDFNQELRDRSETL